MRKDAQNVAIMKYLCSVFSDRKGVTAIEYGLIAGLIAVGLVTTLGLVGTNLTTLFSSVSSSLQTA